MFKYMYDVGVNVLMRDRENNLLLYSTSYARFFRNYSFRSVFSL